MKVHYFQRYSQKENVATANTLLLLSRFYHFSPNRFCRLLAEKLMDEHASEVDIGVIFELQKSNGKSIPDAVISQSSFRIVVETKLRDWFSTGQLKKHLESFGEEKKAILLTLAAEPMKEAKKREIDEYIELYNEEQQKTIVHVNTTFDTICKQIGSLIKDCDTEMQDILEDYRDYCIDEGLIPSNTGSIMRMQLASKTYDICLQTNVYYDSINRPFRPFSILGLYKEKSIRAIGRVVGIYTLTETENGLEYNIEYGTLSEDQYVKKIEEVRAIAKEHGDFNELNNTRFFFVEQFVETDFKKTTPYAPMGSRIFDLNKILNISQSPKDIQQLAWQLAGKCWE